MKNFRQTLPPGSSRLTLFIFVGMLILSACQLPYPRSSGPKADAQATIDALVTENARLATRIASQEDYLSYLATRMPTPLPPPAGPLSPTDIPVVGNLIIAGGGCCVGAEAGQTIQVEVAFEAHSSQAQVTEMRVQAGGREYSAEELSKQEWEPFAPLKIFPVAVPINWSGFYVTAQFRDALGNLSPVYSDDISIEGQLPRPAPTSQP